MKLVTLDGAALCSREQVHALLAQELALPTWYGGNLDALYDCLTDLREPVCLRLEHAATLEEALGHWARGLRRVLQDAAQENPNLTLETTE